MSMFCSKRAALAAALFSSVSALALAQDAGTAGADIVLTPGRSAQSVARSGSAVTVIRADELEKASAKSTADMLRSIPGLFVTEDGGPGQAARLRIRGTEARHTLVLIDGVRANDPSNGASEFDLNAIVPADIERIEVLRGPQSALYGSDAIGGVVNIITRKGRGGYRGYASIEGGSYGVIAGKTGISGGTRDFDYALSLSGARADGFSAYGYRIGRIERTLGEKLENDRTERLGGAAKFAWRPLAGVEIETGLTSAFTRANYDAAFGALPDTASLATGRTTTGYLKLSADAFEGRLKNSLTLFGSHNSRNYDDQSFYTAWFPPFALQRDWIKYDYVGQRRGFEYQGDLKLDTYGKLIFGGGIADERLSTTTRPVQSTWASYDRLAASQTTRSLFALYQLPVGERLDLSLGGRIDDVEKSARFATWRATAAYRIPEWGTKFRASAGTGGKAPSLFQLYSPQWGTRGLSAEHSFGVDAGVDQTLFGGRLTLSATAFHNRLDNLIDFSAYSLSTFSYPACPPAQAFTGCYLNVAKAEISGVELSGDAVLVEGALSARAGYTHTNARDLSTGMHLARRPAHQASLALRWTPLDKLTIEPSVRLVGARYSSNNEVYKLAPYARFDMTAEYQLHRNLSVYLRGENLTNARYQEVYNYGTTGRAAYAGMRATW